MRSSRLGLSSALFVLCGAVIAACGGGSSSNPKPDASGGAGGSDAAVEHATDAGTGGSGGTDAGDASTDATPPPTMLTATVLDRRQTSFKLVWPAPSNNGQAVAGYQVRYAKVPITTTNFDDTTVTTAVAFTGTPAAPGTADGMTVSNLYIENSYYFAVTGTDAANAHVGTFMGTTTGVAAHFNVTLLASPSGTNQLFGQAIDGESDVSGDGIFDLLVSTSNDTHAYLYLGGANFNPTAPSVTFTGANTLFGRLIRGIGDIDKDGIQDLAIGDPNGNRVLIYKGRANWPATLADTDADYTISTDATWAGSGFGVSMAPLGDFDGDGTDDFAIGAQVFNGRVGRVAIIYGRSGFTSFGLPSTTRSLEIGGDATLTQSAFGSKLVGIGHFYTVTTGTTLIVSAPGSGGVTSTTSNEGHLYAFHGRGPGAAIDTTAADHVKVGTTKGAGLGVVVVNLGAAINTLPSVGSGNTNDTTTVTGASGDAYALSGTVATGPFASSMVLYATGSTAVGQVLFGGGLSGRDINLSLIGGTRPDLGLGGSGTTTLDIVDGNKLAGLTPPVDFHAVADVHVPMPTGWMGTTSAVGNLIKDINGDGVPDFALGDQLGTVPGRVAVFW